MTFPRPGAPRWVWSAPNVAMGLPTDRHPAAPMRGSTPKPPSRINVVGRRLREAFRLRRLYLLRAELKFAPTEAQRLIALTVVLGVVCGLAAVLFHLSLGIVEHQLIGRAFEVRGKLGVGMLLFIPTAGGLACGALLQYVFPNARGSGIPQVKTAFATPEGTVHMRDAIGKFIVSTLQIGSGASLGREGPTVHICAGIAAWLGRVARLSAKTQKRLLPVGAAAGIAAAFNAPIAAVTFTIEEVVGNLDQAVLSGVIVAAALAAVIERSVLGGNPIFDLPGEYGLHHASSLLIFALIGVASAVASVIFTRLLLSLRLRFRYMDSVPVWVRPAIGGLVTGLLAAGALVFLGTEGVTGGGYTTLSHALTGQLTLKVMAVLCVMKLLATAFSYSSGGAGGIFAPALFIGGTLGGAIGTLDATLLGHSSDAIGAFALVGMGAVFAGIIRAPITSVLIIVEMTDGYSLILPLMIANMTSYAIARHWGGKPIYEALLEQDGIVLESATPASNMLESLPISSVLHTDVAPFTLVPKTSAGEVKRVASESSGQQVYPVLDGAGCLVGIVTPEEIRILAAEPDLLLLANAADMMRPPVWVSPEDTLRHALDAMVDNGIGEVPVTDRAGRLRGMIDQSAVARAYLKSRRRPARAKPVGESLFEPGLSEPP